MGYNSGVVSVCLHLADVITCLVCVVLCLCLGSLGFGFSVIWLLGYCLL